MCKYHEHFYVIIFSPPKPKEMEILGPFRADLGEKYIILYICIYIVYSLQLLDQIELPLV